MLEAGERFTVWGPDGSSGPGVCIWSKHKGAGLAGKAEDKFPRAISERMNGKCPGIDDGEGAITICGQNVIDADCKHSS